VSVKLAATGRSYCGFVGWCEIFSEVQFAVHRFGFPVSRSLRHWFSGLASVEWTTGS